ncbi:I78 family peptidase inhibitor [Streptomyces sp. 796.1]|uniref:I78 family peptidase inhibitor n=1 Tax=Streptomyces sp. 796.1 TaxID=3163029 RepID=UPI0039C9E487
MAPLPIPSPEPADDLDSYVGLDGETAERRARARGWTTVRTLPPGAVITLEYLGGRLNFTVDDGVVERCWQG